MLNFLLHSPAIIPGISINIRHIEAQQVYLNGRASSVDLSDSMELFMSLQPSDRRAAARMRLVVFLLDILPEVAPPGAIPPGKLPRLASKAADAILKGMRMDGEDLKEVVCFFEHKSSLIRKVSPMISVLLIETAKEMPTADTPSSSSREHASNVQNMPHSSSETTVDLRGSLVTVVADVLLDLAPSIAPSSLPVIAGKVADDIISGGISCDVVPPRAEVLGLVQARMGMIKGLIKEGRQPPVPTASTATPGPTRNAATTSGVVPSMVEIDANLRPRFGLLLPELVPELVRYIDVIQTAFIMFLISEGLQDANYTLKRTLLIRNNLFEHILSMCCSNFDV